MDINTKIFVAGHRGLVGSALVRGLQKAGYNNLLLRTHAELDLSDAAATRRFFEDEKPEFIFLSAAKVGGINANAVRPAEFIHDNLVIQNSVIHEAWRTGIKDMIFLGSSCIYPRECPQPIKEECLLTSPLEPTNRPYALAKIAGIEMCWAYNRQYGTRYLAVMPTNLYGPGDNYDLESSHVLPALIRKMHEAKSQGRDEVILWGTGTPRREFLYSDDMADACIMLMRQFNNAFQVIPDNQAPVINIGCGEDLTIAELAKMVASAVGYSGRIVFDTNRPDGTPRKLLDVSRLKSLGWHPRIALKEGIMMSYVTSGISN